MNRVSIQDLKAQLSSVIARAEAGAMVVITRHGEPVAQLTAVVATGIHRGARVGSGRLRPAIKGGLRGPKGLLLATLLDDRGER